MGASSERRGRKIKREGGHRTPACKACQQRKVKCSGGSPCSACCRKAAWDGVPPPEYCEYDGGFIPARKNPTASTSRQPGSSNSVDSADSKGKGKATKPLQKGLACLACKSRRVRCDGSKPACSSCMRTAKRENREPCCFYRADLHIAQQQLLEARSQPPPPPSTLRDPEQTEEPRTSPPSCSSSSSNGSASPRYSPNDEDQPMKIPESALPPLPVVAIVDSPASMVFPPIPPIPSRSSSSSSMAFSFSQSHSYPPSPSLTHTSTDPSSSYPSPATPYSSVEDFLPNHNSENYPPLPYPPACSDSLWAVPPLALGAPASTAPLPPQIPTCESVEFQTATHDLDLTLTLPMSPPTTFQNLSATPIKTEPGIASGTEMWWH